jgi:hypothetical protein
MTDEELLKQERKQKWHCPFCQGKLSKFPKGVNPQKGKPLSLGIRECHDCGRRWFMQVTSIRR